MELAFLRPNLRETTNSRALSCLTLNIFQEASPTLQDDKPKETLKSALSKLGLDFLDPQPDMAGIKTNEATKTHNHEADGGTSTSPVLDSFFSTLFP
jgi:hypothetical protein